MRVLITTGIFPPDIGGPATQIEYLASGLSRRGFSVSVLTYGAPEKKVRPFLLFAVSKVWPAGLRHFLYFFKLFFLARRSDLIYTTDLYSPGYYSMLAAKFWRKKLVVRFAGDSAWETAQNRGETQDDIVSFQEKKYSAAIEKMKERRKKIMLAADAVIAVSEFMKNLAVKIGVASGKIKVVYNSIDFLPSPPAWHDPQEPVLVFSGRLTPWKGVEMLVRILDKIKEKYPEIIFEILGGGSEKEKLQKLSRELGLEKNINFQGRVSEEESHRIFARSSVFVLNTNYEGLPHSVLNAFRVGLPVITTPVGGNPEVVQSGVNGLLVPYNDERAWEEAIFKMLEDNFLREKFSIEGKRTLEKFKWENVLQKTSELFKSLTE
ncbi:MAG: glycosyltransferase family 4 protein [Candidatus Portnoybacteria bacterium]|nr:glycosyltransferase family 4 protein [Candidatus Portnoybacteria bacterium]